LKKLQHDIVAAENERTKAEASQEQLERQFTWILEEKQ
jgi:hypothetical protein